MTTKYSYTSPSGQVAILSVPEGFHPPSLINVPTDPPNTGVTRFTLEDEARTQWSESADKARARSERQQAFDQRKQITLEAPNPTADELLQSAHAHRKRSLFLAEQGEFQGMRPKLDGKSALEHSMEADNNAMLAVAGYLQYLTSPAYMTELAHYIADSVDRKL